MIAGAATVPISVRGAMESIETAAGPIDADRLGNVLSHEHIFVVNDDYRVNFLPDWDEQETKKKKKK